MNEQIAGIDLERVGEPLEHGKGNSAAGFGLADGRLSDAGDPSEVALGPLPRLTELLNTQSNG